MQHKINYQDIFEKSVNFLNDFGRVVSFHLMMKFRISHEEAREILNDLYNEYENIVRISPDHICLKGNEPRGFGQRKIRKKRKSKFKDITKP